MRRKRRKRKKREREREERSWGGLQQGRCHCVVSVYSYPCTVHVYTCTCTFTIMYIQVYIIKYTSLIWHVYTTCPLSLSYPRKVPILRLKKKGDDRNVVFEKQVRILVLYILDGVPWSCMYTIGC